MKSQQQAATQQPQAAGDESLDGGPSLWSVVVIARNEEATVGESIRSAQAALAGRRYEILLVDSASTDRTVEIARGLGARVASLPADTPLMGPALGRFVGERHSSGEWVLFLDGDMVLLPGWLEQASQALREEPNLVAVSGDIQHLMPVSAGGGVQLQEYPADIYQAATHLAGSALYRRHALAEAGGFNPNMRANEEEELGARLRKLGYRLRRLPVPMTRHHPKHLKETPRELLRRVQRGFYVGAGQVARHAYSYRLPIKRPLAPISRHLCFFTLLTLGVVATAISVFTGSGWWVVGWLALMFAVFAAFALRVHSIKRPAYYFLEWMVTSPSVVWGFIKPPRTSVQFPEVTVNVVSVPTGDHD